MDDMEGGNRLPSMLIKQIQISVKVFNPYFLYNEELDYPKDPIAWAPSVNIFF